MLSRGNEIAGAVRDTVSVGTRYAPAWERDKPGRFELRSAQVCIPTLERGNEIAGAVRATVSAGMHSHAGAWEREICSRVGTRYLLLLVPMLPRGNKIRSAWVCIPTQERGNERYALAWERESRGGSGYGQRRYAFPRRSVGTRYGQRRYAFPRRSVGTR